MNYDVVWGAIAEQMLASLWLASKDRNAVTRAAAWLDRELARAPLTLGESRSSSIHRVTFHSGLAVEYEVIEDDKRVVVQGVFAA